jgi:hypothetical protein
MFSSTFTVITASGNTHVFKKENLSITIDHYNKAGKSYYVMVNGFTVAWIWRREEFPKIVKRIRSSIFWTNCVNAANYEQE